MTDSFSAASEPARLLAQDLIDRIEQLILQAERDTVPLEVDPQRPRLFQMFAEAEAAGFLTDESPIDLTCDAMARHLADRWNLRDLGQAIAQPTRLPPTHLNRLRVLWSFMRLWMEWTYAWQRWHEFHSPGSPAATSAPPESD